MIPKECKQLLKELDEVRGIYKHLIQLLPSFNITDEKILPYGLKPHTRSVSWLVEHKLSLNKQSSERKNLNLTT